MQSAAVRIIAGIVFLGSMFAVISGCEQSGRSQPTESVIINGETFTLELAVDDQARTLGLKHRAMIPDHGGMLFVFPDSQIKVQSFWMHECLTDMDLIFLDRRGVVTAVHRMKTEPPRRADEAEQAYQRRLKGYTSEYPAQFAIEIQAGSLDRLKVRVDQNIELDLSRLKAMAR